MCLFRSLQDFHKNSPMQMKANYKLTLTGSMHIEMLPLYFLTEPYMPLKCSTMCVQICFNEMGTFPLKYWAAEVAVYSAISCILDVSLSPSLFAVVCYWILPWLKHLTLNQTQTDGRHYYFPPPHLYFVVSSSAVMDFTFNGLGKYSQYDEDCCVWYKSN